jgi:ATP-dependent Clp protease adaptor protein ClpS
MSHKSESIEKTKIEFAKPRLFKVILHNDNYTTMEFVVEILENVFYKDSIEAESIMKDVHEKGKGIVGLYPYDLAYTRVLLVEQRAEEDGFPLKITMEAE